jgi:hypothetical protein
MSDFKHKVLQWLNALGIDPPKAINAVKSGRLILSEYRELKRQNFTHGEKWKIEFSRPCFDDRKDGAGITNGHYFHQDLLVARRIYERRPIKHVDVGSRIDGFVAHVSIFRTIEVFDIRPLCGEIPNIKFEQTDIMSPDIELADYCDSLSCLHALEHFGLGRYGDVIDIGGYRKGFAALARMLQSGGILYLSVPIGRERIEFNGHRVFSIARVQSLVEKDFSIIDFSFVDDIGDLHESVPLSPDNYGLNYGCGIFELRRF